ncbi:PA14 domain-containing protein [Chitinophaga polysaccharea]|uniref:PA14 domain-containing protein n=1 Tax=Chitinophaga polysaccharea TaxID=1293035 RepID=A0A561PQC7_9BACT|nr:PA14 domain-containing protein [Chitinophaga polysaccharea]TWF40336.1 PA14 domain-containing protein [Chitinophaga polysaccharea]
MILVLATKSRKTLAFTLLVLCYLETILPAYALNSRFKGSYHMPRAVVNTTGVFGKIAPVLPVVRTGHSESKAMDGGPGQPENKGFHSVNNTNLVDLFSGDFSYSIPLLDVGGYPVTIGYNSGISMAQEASWTGLGWNISPGAITRNLRGLPDDFDGLDTVQKEISIKENKTIGVTAGADVELVGFPLNVGASQGVFHNTYRGWGLEKSVNASINAGVGSMGLFSGGLSVANNSQEGLTLAPSLSLGLSQRAAIDNGGIGGSLTIGTAYNSRTGLKGLQLDAGIRQYKTDDDTKKESTPNAPLRQMGTGSVFASGISFAQPSFTPSMNLPYTSVLQTYTAKVGTEFKVVHPSLFVSGYISRQFIDKADQRLSLPAYGYLNYQHGSSNPGALLDYNREKEIPYREKPAVPNIGVPGYTYDVFSMSGEGTGGMFRAYRGDIGFVYDHQMKSKDNSSRISADVGVADLLHAGVDLNFTRAFTQNGPWLEQNPLANTIGFKEADKDFEAAYFRNPGEKAVNTSTFYDALGGDDVVAADLFQSGNSSSVITTTNFLNRYRNKRPVGQVALNKSKVYKPARDKRTQLITYLNAKEASVTGLSRYIENYTPNQFSLSNCGDVFPDDINGPGVGLKGEYFNGEYFENKVFEKIDPVIDFGDGNDININLPPGAQPVREHFSVKWTGRLKAPVTGRYDFRMDTDDGAVLFLNDSIIMNTWLDKPTTRYGSANLVAGELYNIRLEYHNGPTYIRMHLRWSYPGQTEQVIPQRNLYLMPSKDTFVVNSGLSKEKRVNDFRKAHHISEISVLNADGRRYVYGIPVYNIRQREATFSVNASDGNTPEGLVKYTPGTDNTTNNRKGGDWYFNGERMPAYAHSFLLTGIVSPDYSDLTGDGITDDDPGEAIRFNYSKIAGVRNAYSWRAPYDTNATYNEGLKTDKRDDKGSYVYGEKELWYLHSIESRNMIATFKISDRDDLAAIDENGKKRGDHIAKKLDEINLYTKADFLKHNTAAIPVKTVHFEYTYELCPGVNAPLNNQGKLTLKKIWFSYNGNDKGKKNPYVFYYHANNPGYNNKSYDRWGNYKDALQNPGSSPTNLITNAEYPYALQDSTIAAYNAAAWTLDSLQLPSGGRMKVTYESDDYAYVQNKRAMQLCQVAGFSATVPKSTGDLSNWLYGYEDNLYVAIQVPQQVSSVKEVYRRYLEGIEKIYFRMYVQMPGDKYGSGSEYVPCYAILDPANGYGFINSNTIWVKLKGIDKDGNTGGPFSPLAKAAIQFLRLNLPSKAYPGSDVGDDLDAADAVKLIFSLAGNIKNAFGGFDNSARMKGWAGQVDVTRTYARLNSPVYKKYGGGLRVKRIITYDNWNAMTGQKEALYGQEYQYTTTKIIDGVPTVISSGVASYEPTIGGEENPWKLPLEYVEQVAPLAPVNLGYTETPLGESFFPSAAVGYSKVRIRTINARNTRSANGYDETGFYTSYDFPTITDMTLLADNKKRYRPALANLLRVNAKHFVAISQGFKVELNDMNGKLRFQASYAETDPDNPIAYTENYYRLDNQQAAFKQLNSTVMAIGPDGTIDSAASIGKDVELMVDMREQRSVTNANNFNVNGDFFSFAIPPVLLIPSFLNLAQREENLFRSVAVTKVVNRHGILDSVIVMDKGSRVVTRNLLYDSETGDVVLSSVQNEFNDPVFQLTYPAAWAYDGMAGAYKNAGLKLSHIYIKEGRIISGLPSGNPADYFASGDEILCYSKFKTGGDTCNPQIASFPASSKIWAINKNILDRLPPNTGTPDIYFMDRDGKPFTGNDISMKIIRSGRRNIAATVGTVTMMVNPLVKSAGAYSLIISKDSKIINTSATEFQQQWKAEDKKKQKVNCSLQ